MTREERMGNALRVIRGRVDLWKRQYESDIALRPTTKSEQMRMQHRIREYQKALDIIDDVLEPKQMSLGGL